MGFNQLRFSSRHWFMDPLPSWSPFSFYFFHTSLVSHFPKYPPLCASLNLKAFLKPEIMPLNQKCVFMERFKQYICMQDVNTKCSFNSCEIVKQEVRDLHIKADGLRYTTCTTYQGWVLTASSLPFQFPCQIKPKAEIFKK